MGLYGRQLAEAGRGYLRWTRARVPPEGPGESSTGAKAGVETVGGRQATRSSSRQIPRGTVPGMWLVWYLSTWLEELTPVRKPRDGEFICLAPNTLVPSRNYAFSPLGDAWPFFFFFSGGVKRARSVYRIRYCDNKAVHGSCLGASSAE